MNKKIITKILATMLAFTLTFANVALLGIYTQETLAASVELEEQETSVNKTDIEFDAYFQEEGVETHSKYIDVKTNSDILYLEIKVSNGYLANGTIKLNNSNFSLEETEEELESIQSIDAETNVITLNQINKDESVILEIPIKMNTDSDFTAEELNRVSEVIFEGTYVNEDGKDISFSKTIEVKASMTADAQANLEQEISKYVQFDINGNKGVVLQQTIKSNVTDNVLPVKQTVIEIEIPNINGVEPTNVVLSAISTKATNGGAEKTFTEGTDYTYENGKIILTLKNEENEEGKISWIKDSQDEIILTCVYGENTIISSANVQVSINNTITLYNNEEQELSSSINENITLNEKIGELITYGISTNETSLQKGYMLVSGADNTEYVDTWTANIGASELIDSIVLENETSYLDKNNNEYSSNQVYTYTKITEENLVGILGEDGYINIYNENGELITTLNKENLEYTYQEEIDYIKIETSTPQAEGILSIENGRGIKALEYSEAQEELFVGMKTTISGKVIKNNEEILSGTQSATIAFEEPTTQAELTLSKEEISTVVTNEGVELRVTLKTTDASTVLYENPVIEIVFPKYVTKISAANVRLVYEEELKVTGAKQYENENGNKVIRLELSGEQTKFNQVAQTEGATLIMTANITVDELTPTRTENIETYITNNATNETITTLTPMNFVAPVGMVTVNQISNYNDEGSKVTSISGKSEVGEIETNSVARQATVNMTIINNYEYNCENVVILGRTPFEGNKGITNSEDLGSTFTAQMISAIQATTGITSDQMTVYYSTNGDATRDLSSSENGWTTNPNSLSNIKSFMIILNNYTLNTGDTIAFNYNIQIPENLDHNEATYGIFAVYYNRQENTDTVAQATVNEDTNTTRISANVKSYAVSTTSDVVETAQSTPVGVSTGEGPNLSVELTNDANESAEVEEKSVITYTAKITNNASNDVEGVYLVVNIPDNASYVADDGSYINKSTAETVQISVGTISAGESVDVEFSIKVGSYVETDTSDTDSDMEIKYYDENGNEITEEEAKKYAISDGTLTREDFNTDEEYQEYLDAIEANNEEESTEENVNKITLQVTAKVDGYDDEFTSNEMTNTIIEEDSEVEITMNITSSNSNSLMVGSTAEYGISILKNVSESLNNVVVTCYIPEGMTLESVTKDGVYDESTRTITWTFETFSAMQQLVIRCTMEELAEGIYEKDYEIVCNATCSDSSETFTSNTFTTTVTKEGATIVQTSNISEGYINAGEEITYAITVKNVSTAETTYLITDYLPSDLKFVSYYYTQNGQTTERDTNSGANVSVSITLSAGETLTIYIKAQAQEISVSSKEITNRVILSSLEIESLEANSITHTLIGSDYEPDNDDDGDSTDTTYRISGVAWLDADKNGKRDDTEELLSGIKVYLLDSATNDIISTAETNSNGVYTFSNVEAGKYVIAFEYDTSLYDVTTYQAEGVDTSVNSDVINMLLILNGSTASKYAATNTINVSSNTYNVDLGLVDSPKFDLELTKGVSLIQVSNSKGTQTYSFDNTDLAKIEIPGKNMNGSVVAITYTFTIENTGAVAGYVNKIVDYLPSDLSFSSTLNPEWYQDTDGNLYNSSLANTVINPGEKIEVSLILTKTMTDENTGVVNNTAEIYETSNDQGITDIDSTPGNKATNEDDYGTADVIITVKTGGVVLYVGIVLAVLAIFALRCIRHKEKSTNQNIKGKEGKR